MSDDLGPEIWRGGVNTWQCDEMGHLNVRFYLAIVEEALAAFAPDLGLPEAFIPGAGGTLLVREYHVRYLKEARAADPLHLTAGVLSLGESEARLLMILRHSRTGEPCAAFTVTVAHVTSGDLRPFAWPRLTHERAKGLMVEAPDFARPRGVNGDPVQSGASRERALALGLTRLAAGAVRPADTDIFGRMNSHYFMGRVFEGVARIAGPFQQTVAAHADPKPARVGGAVLENRLIYLRWPTAGRRFEIWSGRTDVDHRTQGIAHWMVDPDTGQPWAVARSREICLDLDARKIVPISEAAQKALTAEAAAGLDF